MKHDFFSAQWQWEEIISVQFALLSQVKCAGPLGTSPITFEMFGTCEMWLAVPGTIFFRVLQEVLGGRNWIFCRDTFFPLLSHTWNWWHRSLFVTAVVFRATKSTSNRSSKPIAVPRDEFTCFRAELIAFDARIRVSWEAGTYVGFFFEKAAFFGSAISHRAWNVAFVEQQSTIGFSFLVPDFLPSFLSSGEFCDEREKKIFWSVVGLCSEFW